MMNLQQIDNFCIEANLLLWQIKMRRKPMTKDPEIRRFLDDMSLNMFGRKRSDCIVNRICVSCGSPVLTLKDEISQKEYYISGFCQSCQDQTYGGEA